MRDQFDNYEKRIMEKLDREAEEIERRIGENPQVAESRANDELDRKVYAGVVAYEEAVAGRNELCTDIENLAGLSPKDREALRLGRELQKRLSEEESEKESEKRTRKHTGMWKRVVAAVAVLVLVVGFGIDGIGGPMRVVEIMKQAVGGREMSQGNSSVNDAKIAGRDAEEEAYQQIKDDLGINPVRLIKLPGRMEFKNYEIDKEIRLAQLLYDNSGENVSYLISDSYTEELWSSDIEDDKIDEYIYEVENVNIVVTEYRLPKSKQEKYKAEFEYKEIYYRLTAVMDKAEFEKLLDFLHFL